MLSLNLKPIFKARGIEKPYTFLVKAGLPPHSATNLLNSKPRALRLDHIELLCDILVCEPNDLLMWVPEKGQNYMADHPLFKLSQQEADIHWKETLASMPLKKLKEVTKTFVAQSKTDH